MSYDAEAAVLPSVSLGVVATTVAEKEWEQSARIDSNDTFYRWAGLCLLPVAAVISWKCSELSVETSANPTGSHHESDCYSVDASLPSATVPLRCAG